MWPMVQDRDHNGSRERNRNLRMQGKAALSCLWSRTGGSGMSTTRGVLYIHSAPSALCPHIEWAVGGVFGMPIRVDWIPQPIERACYRTEYSWSGPTGTAARLASALKGWQRVRFEVTEEATSRTEAERYSYTPTLGVFHAITGIHGDIMIPEDRIKHALAMSAVSGKDLVGVRPALAGVGISNRGSDGRSSGSGRHDLVDDTDLNRLLHSTGDALMFGGELGLQLGPYVVGNLSQLAPVQNPDGGNGSHNRDLSTRPGKDPGGPEGARVHRDVRAAVRLARH